MDIEMYVYVCVYLIHMQIPNKMLTVIKTLEFKTL